MIDRRPVRRLAVLSAALILTHAPLAAGRADQPDRPHAGDAALRPVVEVEEEVYRYQPANNGAGPLWCRGSTCLVRIGDDVFASGLETLRDAEPLNNCRWTLFKRDADGWKLQQADNTGRTREPCPLVGFPDGRLFLSANPTLARVAQPHGGPARPEIHQFSAANPTGPFQTLRPGWEGNPRFSEHSYRSFAADGSRQEMVLFQNIDYTHAEWAFRDRTGTWSAQGKLVWPWGAEYDKPQPIRVCYPTVALTNRAVYFCGVSDIVEPYQKWRDYRKQLTGRDWDYDFRRLFFTWTPDITRDKFQPWVEIASRDKTSGGITPCDLWVGPDGSVHLLWTERARLRDQFFPDARQSHDLQYAVVRDGKVVSRRSLLHADEQGEVASLGRFQVTPDNRLFVFYHVHGTGAAGERVSENRLVEIHPDGKSGKHVRVPLKRPFTNYFTATIRAGSAPSPTLDILGQQAGNRNTMSYGRIRLW
jgi:hypothetical protein